MNYLQMAIENIEQSQGDIRWEGQKERLTQLATVYAAIAQAEALKRIADRLDLLCESGTGYGGEDIAVLRINAMR